MGVNHRRTYDEHAAANDWLGSAEDHEGNLLRALETFVPARGARVLEIGVGTGRVAGPLLGAGCAHLVGVDPAPAVLVELPDGGVIVPEGTGLWWSTVAEHGGAR